MRHPSRIALIIWAAITGLVAASLLIIYLRMGSDGFGVFIQQPPLINLPVTLASVTLVWLSAGALLYLWMSGRIKASNLPPVAGFFVVCWAYLNILSERFRYGDYTYYLDAATSMYQNKPLPGSYFYPPLWATLLQFLVPFGENTFFIVLWLLDFFSLLLFYILLVKILERYGFAPHFSAAIVTLFMLANAPLLRTLVYVQVNLHTLNFILLSLLFYPKRPFLSALMLALAVHLKASPAVIVLAFLLEKDWRWFGWFVVSMALLAGFTVLTDGFSPFLDVLQHVQGLALSDNTIFHDTSIDSFVRSANIFLHMSPLWVRILIYAAKALLAAGTIWIMARCVRARAFFDNDMSLRSGDEASSRDRRLPLEDERKGRRSNPQLPARRGSPDPAETLTIRFPLLNAVPALFVLMTLASPVVWEHHGIFVALSFLLMLKRLDSPAEWLWFGFAYLLEFLLPTFDFFPWSFGRLVAPIIVLWLMWRTAQKSGDAAIFHGLNDWFERMPVNP